MEVFKNNVYKGYAEAVDKQSYLTSLSEMETQMVMGDAYVAFRLSEYPPVEDYLDAVVKGDEAQKQDYIDKCLAVKAKYPKPQGV